MRVLACLQANRAKIGDACNFEPDWLDVRTGHGEVTFDVA